jgi:hypothetical protein
MSRMSGSENDTKVTDTEEMKHGGAPDAGEYDDREELGQRGAELDAELR